MTKEDVFQELLDEWGANKESIIRQTSNSAWDYQKVSDQYEKWLKRYKDAK